MFFLPVELLSPSHLVLLSALAAVVASDNVAGRSPLTLEDRVTILERRVDSLEAPRWRVSDRGAASWSACADAGRCGCAGARKALDCWGRLGPGGITPDMAVPRDVENIDISKNDIKSLPSGLFVGMDKLIELKLGRNKLKVLPDELLITLPELQTLDLSMNELAFLPRRLFRANPALLEVDLSHNVLADLPEGLLISQRNLTVLDVSSNQIEEMKGSLSNLVSLERLALDRNRLGDLDWLESAVCCPNLRHLSASHNEIRTVPDGLAQFRRLETLELGNNKIKQLVPSSLPSSSLVSLDLSRNEIMSIVSSSSLSMVHLRRLDLSGNLLESLSAGSHLRWCPGLRRLDLSNNALGEANLMSMPGELEELLLEGNLLDTLPELDLARTPGLTTLTLEDNLWECTCRLSPFVKSLSSGPPGVQSALESRCFSPEEAEAMPLRHLVEAC